MSSPFPFHGIFSSLGQEPLESLQEPEKSSYAKKGKQQSPFREQKQQSRQSQQGQVAVDIYEQDDYYIIKAPIAGVRLSDLDIEISDNVVTIRGRRQQTDAIPSDQYYLQECFWGEFSRSVTLPCTIDPKRVRATFNKDSVLKILIPKEEKVKIVRINEG